MMRVCSRQIKGSEYCPSFDRIKSQFGHTFLDRSVRFVFQEIKMFARNGLKARPHFALSRQRGQIGRLAGLLPRAVFFPMVAVAFLTAGTAVLWTSNMHGDEVHAVVDAPLTTGTVGKTH
jgi:hypothetical protein